MATLKITSVLKLFTNNQSDFDINGETVEDILNNIFKEYPDLQTQIMESLGLIRSCVNIYVNQTNIKELYGLKTDVLEKDIVTIVPSIAGGSHLRDDLDLDTLPDLEDSEISRYSRQLILPEISIEGQQRLKYSSVLIVGVGALGSPVAMYLAAAGIGRIGLLDDDFVEESNLGLQIIHNTKDIDGPKIMSGADKIKNLNPKVKVSTYSERLTSHNALSIFKDYDVIVDCSDNFPTKYLINDACVFLNKPYVYGSIFRTEGQVSVFYAKKGSCYRCLNPEPRPPKLIPACAQGGVLNTTAAIIGSIQATEVIKLIVGNAKTLINRLLVFNAWDMSFNTYEVEKNYSCNICGSEPTITELIDYEVFCGLKEDENLNIDEITPEELKLLLDANESIQIIDIRQQHEIALQKLPNSISIPFGQVVSRIDELDKNSTVVIVCKVGYLSAKTITDLKETGYKGILLGLKGGVAAWVDKK